MFWLVWKRTRLSVRRLGPTGRQEDFICALKIFEGDIHAFDPRAIMEACGIGPGELDLLVGGPPCQSFSTAGRRRTVRDPRGSLLWQFLRYVEAMQPKFFLMENVRGLVSAALNHRALAQRPERGGPPLEVDEEAGSVADYSPTTSRPCQASAITWTALR